MGQEVPAWSGIREGQGRSCSSGSRKKPESGPSRPLPTVLSSTAEQNSSRTSQVIYLSAAKADEQPEQRYCHISLEPGSKVRPL